MVQNQIKTVKDQRNMLFNQVLPGLAPATPVDQLEWSKGEREWVLSLNESIEGRGSLY